ncbi:hypothetical protein ACFL5A_03660, partial [Gemmatimonadota bacterium]
LVFAWILWRHLADPGYNSLFDGLNLVIHEAGHLAFSWFGEWIGVAGGTLFQLAAPVAAGILFHRQRDYFAVAVALFWLGTNLVDVGIYVADARAQLLPLVSPTSGDPLHDWYYLLAHAGLLRHDQALGGAFRALGLGSMALSLLWGGWMVRVMTGCGGEERSAGGGTES